LLNLPRKNQLASTAVTTLITIAVTGTAAVG
jgi:hypothetical protein